MLAILCNCLIVLLSTYLVFPQRLHAEAGDSTGGRSPIHVVSEDAPSLSLIALELFGDLARWKEIARWNGISDSDHLVLGQVLKLNVPPTLTPEQGKQRLLEFWRLKLGVEEYSQPVQKIRAWQWRAQVSREFQASRAVLEEKRRGNQRPPRTAQGHFDQGRILAEKGQIDRALLSFRESRRIDPTFLPAWFYELSLLKKQNNDDAREDLIDELLGLDPDLAHFPMFYRESEAPASP